MDELRRARESDRRLPDFFIVGHAKCGTTALYKMLKAHPQIYMPDLKEPQFLARDPQQSTRPSTQGPRSLHDYLSLFDAAAPAQRAGEGSTTYLRTPSAPARIAELRPDARIIAIIREPASFLRSLHLQLLQSGIEDEADFATAIGLEQERRRGGHLPGDPFWSQALLYSGHVRYAEQLRRYREHFASEQVLTLIYDDFRLDHRRFIRRVLRFLEVDDSIELEAAEANPTVRVRSQRAEGVLDAVAMGRGPIAASAKAALKTVVPRRVRRDALRAARRQIVDEPLAPDELLMADLRRRFKGEVVAASEYLGRDLVRLWGYDEIR